MDTTTPTTNEGSTKDRLLAVGQALLWRKGFNDTGIQEVLKQTGAPKGSFYHHFQSKEDFGLQVLDQFARQSLQSMDEALSDPNRNPLELLRGFFAMQRDFFVEKGCREGCLIGNFGQELADTNDTFRARVDQHMGKVLKRIVRCLGDAQEAGVLSELIDVEDYGEVLFSAWHGALLRMKVQQDPRPVDAFLRVYFAGASES